MSKKKLNTDDLKKIINKNKNKIIHKLKTYTNLKNKIININVYGYFKYNSQIFFILNKGNIF